MALGLLVIASVATRAQQTDPPAIHIEEPECIVTLFDGGQMIGRLVEETEDERWPCDPSYHIAMVPEWRQEQWQSYLENGSRS